MWTRDSSSPLPERSRTQSGGTFGDLLKAIDAVAFLGFLVLTLATVALFGDMIDSTLRRRHEFGVRLALGATAGQIGRSVVGPALTTTLLGAAIGLVFAVWIALLTRTSYLSGMRVLDPVPALLGLAIVTTVTVQAAAGPAYRATKVDPAHLLRDE